MLIKHICPVCGKIIPINQPRCPEHPSRHKEYDNSVRYIRDKKYHDYYLSGEWKAAKAAAVSEVNGVCVYSFYFEKKLIPYDEVHHIVPLKDDWERRNDVDNLIPLTHQAHMHIETEYKNGDKRRTQELLFEFKKRFKSEFLHPGGG